MNDSLSGTNTQDATSSLESIIVGRRRIFLATCAILAIIFAVGWIIFVSIAGNLTYRDILYNSIVTVFGIVILIFQREPKLMSVAKFACTFLTAFSCILMSFRPGSLLFLVAFPIIAIFLYGKRLGGLWAMLYGLIFFVLNGLNLMSIQYPYDQLIVVIQMLLFVSLISMLFQDSVDKSEVATKEYVNKLHGALEKVNSEVASRKEAEGKLAQSVEELKTQKAELEKINSLMTDRELMMIKLKQRISELEKTQATS